MPPAGVRYVSGCLFLRNFAKHNSMESNKKLALEELGRVDAGTFKAMEKFPVIVMLDNVRSLNNVGSLFRTADAFNIQSLYLCGITGVPPNKEIHKTALGSTETVNWEYFEHAIDAVKKLKAAGYLIASVEQTERTTFLQEFAVDSGQKIALILGNEVEGVAQDLIDASDMILEIPQFGTKHSLNVSVAGGIVIWQAIQVFIK